MGSCLSKNFMNMWSSRDVIKGIGIILAIFSSYTLALYLFSVDSDWIGYYGAVLGCTISIGVIAFTLGQNKKHHKELMTEQSRKHEELVQLQIKTALHAKNQERLRSVITDLRNMYISVSPNVLFNLMVAGFSMQKGNNESVYLLTSDFIKLTTSSLDNYDLIANTNKDIIDLTKLSECAYSYMMKFKFLLSENQSILFTNPSVINEIVDQLNNSIEYNNYKTILFQSIQDAQSRIDTNFIQETSFTHP
jgi:hypothetical protein